MQRIYGSSSGLLQVLERPRTAPTPPELAALPSPSAPTPRRRRTIVCANLTVDGETWDLERTVAEVHAPRKDSPLGSKGTFFRCAKRPGVGIKADWAMDVCLSSWCRACPFKGS